MQQIHPTAIVEDGAVLGENVKIGPYCMVGPKVTLGDDVELVSHAVIAGRTTIGARSKIFPFASIGHQPQDLKYAGEDTLLEIGEDNQIREHTTMNPGTAGGGGVTRVGNGCLFMMGTHVGHDCLVGNGVIMANNATLAGHVEVEDHVIFGGLSAVRQWCRVGAHSIIGGLTGVEFDVIPYGSVIGDRARLAGLNLIGLKRRNFSREEIHALRGAYKEIFNGEEGTLRSRADAARTNYAGFDGVQTMTKFMLDDEKRSFCTPRKSGE
ncbi:Acyl-[acyl-carrier-protein]--UDP-N-acetylglucosamine O-acyltransferase [Pseudovibrio axinellae]|uniref:Acyl-[acyl-carrier-protein]--UDP-N-acetylglucosamine O-acyltransferase n=1 Tax=Pseudovibrio axinellae TaxID=989403 RepID=A0A166B4U6_9HYPH|nr:acyl-ACP--UDP-N-acetylglucosamine O-acyltransferase [Pseudovibrio axinellae]KZL21888.1 Acyl-[acyl-carrier-protein]--UDP-N-acetylglucosamine O-acyltransferase [Pseudovibrio axinellae]SEQ82466.1 acyl-[acyl-carrier-protein]--UDP-N-acetylglucosamine O-acyltransferase [Pseudovibrio axinellae]